MPASMSTLQDVLKNFYIGPIRENLNQATVLLSQLKKSSKEVVGEQVILPLHMGRNWSVGARGTTGTVALPTISTAILAGQQQYKKTTFTTKDVYGRIQIFGKTIRATKTDKGAFLRAVTSETKGMVDDLGSDINRQLWGDGTGTLATVQGTVTSATQTVDTTQYLEEGMYVDQYSAAGALTSSTHYISTINSATSVTFDGSMTCTDLDVIRLHGVTSAYELNGLALITANTGSLEGIDPATTSLWKGNVYGDDTAPVALKEAAMQQVLDANDERGGKTNFIGTSYAGRAQYVALLRAQKRFTNPEIGKLKGGYKYIDFNDVPLVVDRHCPRTASTTRMYFLSLDTLGIYRMADFEWAQEDGAVLARIVGIGATESYEGTLVCDMEFATDARRRNGVLKGISTTV